MDDTKPQFVRVPLGEVLPNPFRKIPEYPLNPGKIEHLCSSIRDTDLWKNVIVRESPTQPGRYEMAYGHHRIAAGIKELGADHEHWFPLELYSNYQMMRVLAHENSDDWSSPVEHWMLVVDVARDWLESYVGREPDSMRREIVKYYAINNNKAAKDFLSFSPEIQVFIRLYTTLNRALSALESAQEMGVTAIQIAQFLGDRFVERGINKTGGPINQPNLVISRAFDLLPLSPKRKAYLETETLRKEQERLDQDEKIRKAQELCRERVRLERKAADQAREEQQKRREAEKRQIEEEAKERAASLAQRQAPHENERRIAEAEQRIAQARAQQAADEKDARHRAEGLARRKAEDERKAKEGHERHLQFLEEERDRQERTRIREQAMFERLQQDGQVDPEAIRLCKTWVMAAAFRDKVLEPNVQLYLPKEQQKGLLLDIINTKKERLTPEVLVREIDIRLGRVERVAAEMAELGTRIERAAEDVTNKVRSARRAIDTLRVLIEQARQDRNQVAMVSAIAAISHANFAEVVRTIDDLKQDAEALAGIASPRPSNGSDAPSPDRPSLTLVAG
jgi:hypothetical protein